MLPRKAFRSSYRLVSSYRITAPVRADGRQGSLVVLVQRIGGGPFEGHRLTFSFRPGKAHVV
jgi:hypothetical protein